MSFKSFAYDGWNHLRGETESATETESHTTSFALDDFGRATQTTLSDGSIVSREYADFSPEPLLTRICVNGVTAGTQTFDGLGRCVESVSGDRKHRFKYQDAASGQPVEVIGPDNRSIVFTRIPELNDAIKETRVGSIRQQFNYHPLTGAMAAATVGDCCTENSFYESGRLKETKEYRNGQLTQQARYFYSSGGTLYRQTDVLRGIDKTFSRDNLGRITGIDDNGLHTRLSYDALGRLKQLRTEIGADGRICTTDITWDALGRETARHMELPSLSVTQTSTWQLDDLLASRKSVSSTGGESFETFSYDNRSRLVRYANEAENSLLPQDEYGRPFRGQTFAYDVWSNVTMVGTDYLGSPSESIAVYAFNNPSDPCQLTGISYSHTDPDQLNRDGSLRYDAAGRVIQDDRGRLFTWDDAGRLAGATDGNSCGDYAYDALNRMIQLPNEAGVPQYREYLGGVLAAIRDAGNDTRIARAGGQCVALVHNRAGCEIELLGCDRNGSVITAGKKASARRYTPYGVMNGGSSNRQSPGGMPLGFNGEGVDAMTGLYHLGNGYRPYSPVLMRFMAPDSLSPFGAGGINPYAYCSGDPINHTDPSGHIGFWKLFGYIGLAIAGVALAVTGVGAIASSVIAGAVTISVAEAVVMAADAVSLGTGIASEVVHGTTAKKWLGIASLVTGLVGVGYGAVKSAPKLIKGAKGLFKEAGELLPEGSMPRAKFKNGSPYKKGGPEHPVKVRVAGKNTITRKYDPKIYRQEAANSFKAYDNGHGSRVWLTKYETNVHIVRSKMEDIILRSEQPPANVFVLSGTHGEDLGSRLEQPHLFAVREFLEEDAHSASAVHQQGGRSNITVVDVPSHDQAALTEILHAENSVVIGAFCHSRNDRLITDALSLRPKTSWIPDHRFGPNHASW